MSEEVWAELSATMRALRHAAGLSLRQLERRCGWGRGTLSQLENGKARPNRDQVEWYDENLGGHGLLLSLYAEARGARADRGGERGGMRARDGGRLPRPEPVAIVDGDAFEVVGCRLASGQTVPAGTTVDAGWTLCNAGSVPWQGRAVARVGAPAALRLIASASSVPLPDCRPGEAVTVTFPITVPNARTTFAAYWQIVDGQGRQCYGAASLLPVVVLAR